MKLLCTDLDRTLLPNGDEPECVTARPLLWHMLDSRSTSLAYVSGRDLARVLEAIDEYALQLPDVIVADVGSSIYLPGEEGWVKNGQWQSTIASDWNDLDGDDINRQLRNIDGLTEQEPSRQAELKSSYYFDLDADREQLRDQVAVRLQSTQIKASLVMSDDVENDTGLLDVLPKRGNKRGAVEFIQHLVDSTPDNTLFAGDSGNDVAAITCGVAGVAVANTDADTRQAIHRQAVANETLDSTYQATGDLQIAGNRVLNGNYAAGILEGLIHFRPAWHADLLDAEWVDEALARYPSTLPLPSSKRA